MARHAPPGHRMAYEHEIGAAWRFATQQATGLTVVLRELPAERCFDLLEINPAPAAFNTVTSTTPAGNMPHLRAAVRNAAGRYDFIGDAWRSLAKDGSALIHVRLRPGTMQLRFALFEAPLWTP